MMSGRRPAFLLVVFFLLVLGYLFLGFGSGSVSGRAQALDLLPIEPDATLTGHTEGNDSRRDTPEDELPPESTLDHGGTTSSSEGQIPGLWEPPGFFFRSNGSGTRSRTGGPLMLTDGELLTVPAKATLKFRYSGEADPGRDVFDALAFEIADGEPWRAEDEETGELRYLEAQPRTNPLALPVKVPEMAGQEAARVEMEMSPGAYVVSASASAEEGNTHATTSAWWWSRGS